ncbi:short chain aldehyde dehydrogenase 1-like [Malania oleifera]|uniref:short chain aldehyde dehydrogenase 1-like n=1 Tax=Malania oleifera TaxID=397392 RepID=UPI0025AE3B20|nr:short chain aldehyde dehydrogenase 1-like [Malania oleifera]
MAEFAATRASICKGDKFSEKACPQNALEKKRTVNSPYTSVVRSLMYVQTYTIPDISFAVGMLRRYQSNPEMEHWKAAKKVLRYLKGTRHSGGAISWKSAKQTIIAASTMEAKFVAYFEAVIHVLWLRNFISGLEIVNSNFPSNLVKMSSASLLVSNPIPKRLGGKVALITGGASGIGESTARLFVRHGAKVVIADVQDDLGHSVCESIGSCENISYAHCDVTSDSDVRNAVDMTVSKYGKLDIMFNNAGIQPKTDWRILAVNDDDFKKVLYVNVFGAYLGAKHAARMMIPAKKGCILFTSSVASVIGVEAAPAYVASKHAVVGLAKNLCMELGQYGIRVNSISPFAVGTPLVRNLMDWDDRQFQEVVSASANLKGVTLEPEDIAEGALYLASDESKYVSGINLVVDGGYTATNPSFSWAAKSRLP